MEEYVNNDARCDKPYDMMTSQGRAVADLCNFAKANRLTPWHAVWLELTMHKGGAGKLSAYTQELVNSQPSLQEYLRSRH